MICPKNLIMPEELNQETIRNIKELLGANFYEFAKAYIANSERYIENIKKGFQEKDFKKISDAAHPLKSSSATIGFLALSSIAKKVEYFSDDVARNRRSSEDVESLLDDLYDAFKGVRIILAAELNRENAANV